MAVLTNRNTIRNRSTSSDGQSLTGYGLKGKNIRVRLCGRSIWDDSLPLWKNVKQALKVFSGVGDICVCRADCIVGGQP